MKQEQQHLLAIGEIISKFLNEQGGFANGSQTWVEGYVSSGRISHLDWSTPKIDNITFAEHKNLGSKLYSKISEYLKNNELKSIELSKNHIEWGS
jgi:hypothetical protein